MSTTVETIRRWLEDGKEQNATHMFVVTDTFDYDDYPVYFSGTVAEARGKASCYPSNMQTLTEVYRLDMNWDAQLDQLRAFNF